MSVDSDVMCLSIKNVLVYALGVVNASSPRVGKTVENVGSRIPFRDLSADVAA